LDGEIAEFRETLRLDPNNARAHNLLGYALEHKNDQSEALQEYRTTCMLDPKSAVYKQSYEDLLHRMNRR
jgi:Flp pilus assembly protein TadD